MPNQYTKAEEQGTPKPAGANQFTTGKRERHDPVTRDKMRAEHAALALQEILDNPESTTDQKIAASKALLPYGKSTYSSIESKELSEFDGMSEEETYELVRALITSSQSLILRVIDSDPGLRAAVLAHITSKPVVVEQQNTHIQGNARLDVA